MRILALTALGLLMVACMGSGAGTISDPAGLVRLPVPDGWSVREHRFGMDALCLGPPGVSLSLAREPLSEQISPETWARAAARRLGRTLADLEADPPRSTTLADRPAARLDYTYSAGGLRFSASVHVAVIDTTAVLITTTTPSASAAALAPVFTRCLADLHWR